MNRIVIMQQRTILIYAGLLMSLSAFSIDIILPSVPEMARDLSVDYDRVQWTITLFLIALGLGQLFWGLISDRFGRRPSIGFGLAIFMIGSILCAFAPNSEILIAARLLQGFGAAAASVCSRAIIRDMYEGSQLAQAMAIATAIFAFGPIIAPFFGVVLSAAFGWRMIFAGLLFLGLLLTIMLIFVPETNEELNPNAMRPAVIRQSTRAIWQHPQSRHFLLLGPFALAPMIVILVMLPPLYAESFGIEGVGFALLFALHGLGIVAGQIINRYLIKRFGTLKTLVMGAVILVFVSSIMATIAVLGQASAINFTVLITLFATSYLVVVANATSMFLDPQARQAGYAAAVSAAFAQFGSGVLVTLLASFLPLNLVSMAFAILLLCVTSLGGALLWMFKKSVPQRI